MKIQLQTSEQVIFESALFRTTTTLLIGEKYLLLVDPNWLPIEIEYIADFINNNYSVTDKKCYLLFTHSDYDHIIGYGKFKAYKTIASQRFTTNPEKDAVLSQIRDFDDQNYIERDYPIEYPRINLVIKEEAQKVHLGEDVYEFYSAPGHNRDGMISMNLTRGILIVGDYLSNIEFPYIYHSISAYESTLDTLETLIVSGKVNLLISGHGDYTSDRAEMLKRIGESRGYMDQLMTYVIKGDTFDLDALFSRYQFPKIMKKFHDGNVTLAKKELLSSSSKKSK